ncbi:DNA binding domain-containing protein, excisionase family [Filimonas lacunae]|uniref:DNA binding domain-containing protein, excisionase family n=2 Tax=Filimonas lacunae TaxID=477680 RepID=A0A1N7RHM3_9BACT|nr:DNA binding domain-containing protein, excisionase family [Filimonas lacunae]
METMNHNEKKQTVMLFPFDPEVFWQRVRLIIREEVSRVEKAAPVTSLYETPGLEYKPLYKIEEVCQLFQISKPTIYSWVECGKLKPVKIRSRVFFLWQDIQSLLKEGRKDTAA